MDSGDMYLKNINWFCSYKLKGKEKGNREDKGRDKRHKNIFQRTLLR
jgi:hypothetical protein